MNYKRTIKELKIKIVIYSKIREGWFLREKGQKWALSCYGIRSTLRPRYPHRHTLHLRIIIPDMIVMTATIIFLPESKDVWMALLFRSNGYRRSVASLRLPSEGHTCRITPSNTKFSYINWWCIHKNIKWFHPNFCLWCSVIGERDVKGCEKKVRFNHVVYRYM